MLSQETQPLQPDLKDLFGPEEEITEQNGNGQKKGRFEDFLARMQINSEMLIYKIFYFFYFAANGALLPYLSLYFKYSLLLPAYFAGIVIGVRPFCLFVAAPIQGMIADKYNKVKTLLLVALFGLIASHLALTIVPPVTSSCLSEVHEKLNATMNGSSLHQPTPSKNLTKAQANIVHKIQVHRVQLHNPPVYHPSRQRSNTKLWQQAWLFDVYTEIDPEAYRNAKLTFIVALVITVLGQLIGATSLTLADVATFQNLGNKPEEYGKQRLWGVVGWGLTAFITGTIVSSQYDKKMDICPDELYDIYRPFFYVYGILMAVAIFVATRIRFSDGDKHRGEKCALVKSLQIFTHAEYVAFAYVAVFMGMSVGAASSFLDLHLVELGATPALLSALVGIQCVSDVILYYGSDYFITHVGHIRMACVGMLVYALRFYYFSAIEVPWLVLPIEFISGVCNAMVWSALATYVGTPPRIGATLQGILHAMYYGLGKGLGQICGGLLIRQYGTDPFFRYLALIEFVLFLVFALLSLWLSPKASIWIKLSGYKPIDRQDEAAGFFSKLSAMFKGKRN